MGVIKPFDGQVAAACNGAMVALVVDALHSTAIVLSAAEEGAPGDRGGGFCAGHSRDLDGNKLNVFCMG